MSFVQESKDFAIITSKKVLECPICFEQFKPPIFQCKNGHSVCHLCKSQLDQCPLCREAIAVRNLQLEDILESLPMPCKYKTNGCKRVLDQSMRAEHEIECPERTIACFFVACEQYPETLMPLSQFHGHWKRKHACKEISDYKLGTLLPLNSYCIKVDGKVFYACSKFLEVGNKTLWKLVVIGNETQEKIKSYKFVFKTDFKNGGSVIQEGPIYSIDEPLHILKSKETFGVFWCHKSSRLCGEILTTTFCVKYA